MLEPQQTRSRVCKHLSLLETLSHGAEPSYMVMAHSRACLYDNDSVWSLESPLEAALSALLLYAAMLFGRVGHPVEAPPLCRTRRPLGERKPQQEPRMFSYSIKISKVETACSVEPRAAHGS